MVKELEHFTDGSARPSSNAFGSVGCVPRPLQQVQADGQRVERGQPRLHGPLHPEQGRQQKDRQKCEFTQDDTKKSRMDSVMKWTITYFAVQVVESGELPSRAMERGDSAQSFASSLARYLHLTSLTTVDKKYFCHTYIDIENMLVKRLLSIVSSRKDSGGSEGVARRGDEVAIVVSNRKDSLTNAVR